MNTMQSKNIVQENASIVNAQSNRGIQISGRDWLDVVVEGEADLEDWVYARDIVGDFVQTATAWDRAAYAINADAVTSINDEMLGRATMANEAHRKTVKNAAARRERAHAAFQAGF